MPKPNQTATVNHLFIIVTMTTEVWYIRHRWYAMHMQSYMSLWESLEMK